MELQLGVVCGDCDTYSDMGTSKCPCCGSSLALRPKLPKGAAPIQAKAALTEPPSRFDDEALVKRRNRSDGSIVGATEAVGTQDTSAAHVAVHSGASSGASVEELMYQAKNFVCRSCSTPIPTGHKFCGRCGSPVPPDILAARTQFFGQLQAPGKAKLILIRGEGAEGLSYQLNAEEHLVGRDGQLVFPDDPFVSPRHANLFYRDGHLVVRDEGSLNGVFVRVHGTTELVSGDEFLAGEQLFRLDGAAPPSDEADAEGTSFYTAPKQPSFFRVTQVLLGGARGMVVCARAPALQIGREGGDLNFPADPYMSATHCRLDEVTPGNFTLTDFGSRNGTYVRLKAERELVHGDYLFIGRKLLRVEITAA